MTTRSTGYARVAILAVRGDEDMALLRFEHERERTDRVLGRERGHAAIAKLGSCSKGERYND
jgi:hypothetical protein